MGEDRIEVGDIVTFCWDGENIMLIDVEVLYVPQATGDAWHIRDKDGNLHYVQQYESITRKDRND